MSYKFIMKRIDETYVIKHGDGTSGALLGPVTVWEDVTSEDHVAFKIEAAMERRQ